MTDSLAVCMYGRSCGTTDSRASSIERAPPIDSDENPAVLPPAVTNSSSGDDELAPTRTEENNSASVDALVIGLDSRPLRMTDKNAVEVGKEGGSTTTPRASGAKGDSKKICATSARKSCAARIGSELESK